MSEYCEHCEDIRWRGNLRQALVDPRDPTQPIAADEYERLRKAGAFDALFTPARGPVREYRTVVHDSGDPGYVNRIMIGVATTGLVRVEWVQARFGQLVPCNWSQVEMLQWMDSFMPLRFQVDDAQNLIIKQAIAGDFEWLLLYEHDVCPPANAFMILNEYMRAGNVPVVSGLYYTRTRPSEPVLYRGRGTGYFDAFKPGDLVWTDGVPTGFLLVHMGLIRAMWADAEEYAIKRGGHIETTRRVFRTPRDAWYDPQTGQFNAMSGTSDLDWCSRVISGHYFEKSGWKDYEGRQFPFLCDTRLFCRHINVDGEVFP